MSLKTGAQVWNAKEFKELRGKRIGFVANHTAMLSDSLSTLEALTRASGVDVAALFGPEHGAFGAYDDNVPDQLEPLTGLMIRSLYGEHRKPQPRDVAGLDALVFEIQDIGARFYTYASTLGLCLEACAEAGIQLIVLDRPNPITGTHCEGPIADVALLSFTAYHPIPIRHGMTLGELARLYAIERNCEANLRVAPCVGLTRDMWFDQTGLTWRNPSPAMRSLAAATLYPGVCLLEQTNFSMGRGTDAPFEMIGAPYVEPDHWVDALSRQDIPGISFARCSFTPTLRDFAGQLCHGVRLTITDRDRLDAVSLGISLITTLMSTFPGEFDPSGAIKLLANATAYDLLMAGADASEVCGSWSEGLAQWARRREPALIYP